MSVGYGTLQVSSEQTRWCSSIVACVLHSLRYPCQPFNDSGGHERLQLARLLNQANLGDALCVPDTAPPWRKQRRPKSPCIHLEIRSTHVQIFLCTIPGFDGGDCCQCTCVDASFTCGDEANGGFDCIDPNAPCANDDDIVSLESSTSSVCVPESFSDGLCDEANNNENCGTSHFLSNCQ